MKRGPCSLLDVSRPFDAGEETPGGDERVAMREVLGEEVGEGISSGRPSCWRKTELLT